MPAGLPAATISVGESVVDVPFNTHVVVIVIAPLLTGAGALDYLLNGQGAGHEVVGVGDVGLASWPAAIGTVWCPPTVVTETVLVDAVHGLVNGAGRAGRDAVVNLSSGLRLHRPGPRNRPAPCRRS